MSPADAVVVVSSGVGASNGGIGVVTQSIVDAFGAGATVVWRHHSSWLAPARRGALATRAALGVLRRPRLVVYEHVDLAALHTVVPGLSRVPHAVFLHGVEVWRPITGRRRSALTSAARLLANSDMTVRLARAANPWLPHTTTVHLGVAAARRPPPPTSQRAPIALMVGRMAAAERYKGHDQVLSAWNAIAAAHPESRLWVVGGGDDAARLRLRAQRERLSGVTFLGWIDNANLTDLYDAARVLMFPSAREGFGLVAAEAAAHGAAVVGLAGTVLEELFPDGSVALAPTQDAAAIAATTIPLLADATRAQKIADAGRVRVETTFLAEHFRARLRAALSDWIS